jgi:hypothetical protein
MRKLVALLLAAVFAGMSLNVVAANDKPQQMKDEKKKDEKKK